MNTVHKKIVVIGPESTGKSSLCKKLAAHYNTLWVEEYAREYLLKNGKEYSFADLKKIAQGQLELEEKALQKLEENSSSLLIIDTDMYVMKVWSEFVFNACDNTILNEIVNRQYDLYLICKPDLLWVPDELREYPDEQIRNKLFHYYKDAMVNQKVPWVEIDGDYDQRFDKAIKAINTFIL
jgi:hypothetical protein